MGSAVSVTPTHIHQAAFNQLISDPAKLKQLFDVVGEFFFFLFAVQNYS